MPRHREAGRRKDRTTMTPAHRKGPPQAGQAAAFPTRCCFHLLPTLVYRKGHLCGIPMPLSPSRRSPSTVTPRGRLPRRRKVTTPACRNHFGSSLLGSSHVCAGDVSFGRITDELLSRLMATVWRRNHPRSHELPMSVALFEELKGLLVVAGTGTRDVYASTLVEAVCGDLVDYSTLVLGTV